MSSAPLATSRPVAAASASPKVIAPPPPEPGSGSLMTNGTGGSACVRVESGVWWSGSTIAAGRCGAERMGASTSASTRSMARTLARRSPMWAASSGASTCTHTRSWSSSAATAARALAP